MTPPTVQFIPASAPTVEVVGTCTGWSVQTTNPIRSANGWTAGPFGTGSIDMDLRNDSLGAFIRFNNGTNASAFIASHGARNIEIVHDSGTYAWNNSSGGGMSIFATVFVRLNLSGWSGTIPDATDAASVNLA
jgi:hypothetical protein